LRELKGRTALVTGASRGVGKYIAEALCREGMSVVLLSRSSSELDAVAAELGKAGSLTLAINADLANTADLEQAVQLAEAKFGAIDLLVNNAGLLLTSFYHTLTPHEIEQIVRVNLVGPMILSRLVLPGMLQRKRGHIVNVASMEGKYGVPYDEPYCASKSGIIGFTRSLRAEYRNQGVSASVVIPTYVSGTGMYQRSVAEAGATASPPGGLSSPNKIAEAVVRAVRKDKAEILAIPKALPSRLIVASIELFPRLNEVMMLYSGTGKLSKTIAEYREREKTRQTESMR